MSEGQNFRIFVVDDYFKQHGILVNKNDTVATLKSKIRQELNYIRDDQVFEIMCNGEFLDEKDKETSLANKISDYDIDSGTTVNVNIVEERQCQCGCNLKNCNEQRKIDNQIIEENQDEKEDSEEIINTENETKTNNEEDNENKDDKLNSKQNLNASELNESKNSKTNLESTNEKINSQIDNYVQENVLTENYISDEIDSSSNSDENTNNDNDDDDDNDCESSQNLDHKLKEDEKIIKEKDEKMIKPENEIEINNSSEVNLNLNLDNKDGEINSKQNLNVSELNKNENNEKNLDLINNEINFQIGNGVQENIMDSKSGNRETKNLKLITGILAVADILLFAAAVVTFFYLHIAIPTIFFILALLDSFVVVVRLKLVSCGCVSLINLKLFWTKSINKSQSKKFNSKTPVVINKQNQIKE